MKNCRKNCRIKWALFGVIWSNMIKLATMGKRDCFSMSSSEYGAGASVGAWIRTSILRIRKPGLLLASVADSRDSSLPEKLSHELSYLLAHSMALWILNPVRPEIPKFIKRRAAAYKYSLSRLIAWFDYFTATCYGVAVGGGNWVEIVRGGHECGHVLKRGIHELT